VPKSNAIGGCSEGGGRLQSWEGGSKGVAERRRNGEGPPGRVGPSNGERKGIKGRANKDEGPKGRIKRAEARKKGVSSQGRKVLVMILEGRVR